MSCPATPPRDQPVASEAQRRQRLGESDWGVAETCQGWLDFHWWRPARPTNQAKRLSGRCVMLSEGSLHRDE